MNSDVLSDTSDSLYLQLDIVRFLIIDVSEVLSNNPLFDHFLFKFSVKLSIVWLFPSKISSNVLS